jgi:hypothetical protein
MFSSTNWACVAVKKKSSDSSCKFPGIISGSPYHTLTFENGSGISAIGDADEKKWNVSPLCGTDRSHFHLMARPRRAVGSDTQRIPLSNRINHQLHCFFSADVAGASDHGIPPPRERSREYFPVFTLADERRNRTAVSRTMQKPSDKH